MKLSHCNVKVITLLDSIVKLSRHKLEKEIDLE